MTIKYYLFLLFFAFAFQVTAQPKVPKKKVLELKDKYLVEPVSINSEKDDFSPFLVNGTLFFISNRSTVVGLKYTSNTNENTCDIYSANQLDSINFSKPKPLNEFNTAYDDGPVMFSKNGTYALFSASSKKGKLQLYFSILENGKWSKPLLHPVSRPGDSYCHPFLLDEKTLFFCSDKAGGRGGMDIYYSRFENYNWSNPVNLGPKVNTSYNELFPYVSKDAILYFSSKNASGKSDLDIFSFSLKDSSISKPIAMEAPINSSADDFGICFNSDLRSGYFSSNRNKNEGDNVFYFNKVIADFTNCVSAKQKNCYSFLKEKYALDDELLGNEYEWDFGDGNKAKAKAVKHCYSNPGFYTVKLNVVEKNSGKIVYNELTYTIAVRPQGLVVDVKDTLYINEPVHLTADRSQIDGYSIVSYNWFFNDTSFALGPQATHTYTENGIYRVELGVEAINKISKELKKFCVEKWVLVGDKEYIEKNLRYFKYAELQADADSLYFQDDEDVSLNTINPSKKKFRYAKLGEDAFSLNEQSGDDVLLSEQERKLRSHKFGLLGADESGLENMSSADELAMAKQRLARFKNSSLPPIVDTIYFPKEDDEKETLFRVNLGWSDSKVDKNSGVFEGIKKLEETIEGNRYRYTSGNEKSLTEIVPYYEQAKQKGFKDASVISYSNKTLVKGQAKNLHAALFDSALVALQALKVFFKYDVVSFDEKYYAQIDELIAKSKNKSNQKVALITHFDGLGGLAYNTKLNTARTNKMIDYLVSKGIKKSLIKTEFIIHPTEKLEPDLLRRIEVFLMN